MQAINKYVLFCQDAQRLHDISFFGYKNLLYRLELKTLPSNIENMRGQCGYFYEYHLEREEDLIDIIHNKCQTITYFGIDKFKLRDFILRHRLRGVDRIVPIGSALDINVIWDGYDIIRSLSRIIDVV